MRPILSILILSALVSSISAEAIHPRQDVTASRSIPLPTFTLQISTLPSSLQESIDQLSLASINDPITNSFSLMTRSSEMSTTSAASSTPTSTSTSGSSTESMSSSGMSSMTASESGMGDDAFGLKVPQIGGPLVIGIGAVLAGAMLL